MDGSGIISNQNQMALGLNKKKRDEARYLIIIGSETKPVQFYHDKVLLLSKKKISFYCSLFILY